jgi:cytochrome c
MRATGTTWGDMSLDYFLASPEGFVPGTTMNAAGIADPQSRTDLIGYLKAPH